MKVLLGLILVAILCTTAVCPAQDALPGAVIRAGFIENRGQWPAAVRYAARFGGMKVFVENRGWAFTVLKPASTTAAAVRMRFADASASTRLVSETTLPGRYNYLLGEQRRWRTAVPAFETVRFASVYPGVDARLRRAPGGAFEDHLLLEPDADLSRVMMKVDGASKLHLEADGTLVMETAAGPVRQPPPDTWEVTAAGAKRHIACDYVVLGPDRFGFAAPGRDPEAPLVVDPQLVFGTLLGGIDGMGGDSAAAVTVGPSGVITIAGSTWSTSFPTTTGAFDSAHNGGEDAFVARLDPAKQGGQQLVYCTFLGGTNNDTASGVTVDSQGVITVAGTTRSPDFPSTPGAFDRTHNGQQDAFVVRLDPSRQGSQQLVYSTFLGGNQWEGEVRVSASAGSVLTVVGETPSTDFPSTPGAYDTTLGGFSDVFVAQLDLSRTGSQQLVYGTYLGGDHGPLRGEKPAFVAVDAAGVITVGGYTECRDFPTTPNAFNRTFGDPDAYLVRLDPSRQGSQQLRYGTYLAMGAYPHGGAVDANGVATIVGSTFFTVPFTPGAFDSSKNGAEDAFVLQIDPTRPPSQQLRYGTLVGGTGTDSADAVAVDASGVVTLVGKTSSTDFPVTATALKAKLGGRGDGLVARLDPARTGQQQLRYATYVGGSNGDSAGALEVGPPEVMTIVGLTGSTDFPTTPGAFQSTPKGQDAFIVQIGTTRLDAAGTARPGGTVSLALTAAEDPGLPYQLGSSLGTGPIVVGNRRIALSLDDLLRVSVTGVLSGIFTSYSGVIGATGQATAVINIPNLAALVGQQIHTAFVVLDVTSPSVVRAVSNVRSFTIQS